MTTPTETNATDLNALLNAAPDQTKSIGRLEAKLEALGRKREAAKRGGLRDLVGQVDAKVAAIGEAIVSAKAGTLAQAQLTAALSWP